MQSELIGNWGRPRTHVVLPRSYIPTVIKADQEKQLMAVWDSCVFKSMLAAGAGKTSALAAGDVKTSALAAGDVKTNLRSKLVMLRPIYARSW